MFSNVLVNFQDRKRRLFPVKVASSLRSKVFRGVRVKVLVGFFRRLLGQIFSCHVVAICGNSVRSFDRLCPRVSNVTWASIFLISGISAAVFPNVFVTRRETHVEQSVVCRGRLMTNR